MRRIAIDLAFAAAVVAAGVLAIRAWRDDGPPPVPTDVCLSDGETARPRRELLVADGRITIAALFAQMSEGRLGDDDHGFWSLRRFVAALEAAGFRRTRHDGSRDASTFERILSDGTVVLVDVLGPRSLPREEHARVIGDELGTALASHEIVYYNGGAYGGSLSGLRRPPGTPWPGYRIVILDSCWSLQYYAAPLLGGDGAPPDLIVNRERAITGSVESLLAVLGALVDEAPTWTQLIDAMNGAAARRASVRLLHPRFRAPEHYGLAVACR